MASLLALGSVAFGGVQQLGTGVAHATNYGQGYVLFAQDGGVFNFGNVGFHGSIYDYGYGVSTETWLKNPWVSGAVTSDKGGYWAVTKDEKICAFGDAAADTYPSSGAVYSQNSCWINQDSTAPTDIVGMASAGAGSGTTNVCPAGTQCSYWLVGADGGVFAFGNAGYYGSIPATLSTSHPIHLNAPIVGMAATPDDKGYWLVGSDGGVYSFGDATFYGSMGGKSLNAPIVGMATENGWTGTGYWLVGADGGIFSFGAASYFGSMGGTTLAQPVVGVIASSDGGGYLEVAADGGIFTFGDFAYQGAQSGGGHASTNPTPNAVVAASGS